MEENKKIVGLSASRVKTLSECSYYYYCRYHLKMPDSSNSGSKRGSVCHDLFELLTKPKWIRFAKEFRDSGCDFDKFPLIKRFLRAKCSHYELEMYEEEKKTNKTNIGLIYEMVEVGLNAGFFPEKNEQIIDSEYAFDILDEELEFRIIGFIDRITYDRESGTILISDFKSSKSKFQANELETNIQAMMYALATYYLEKAGKLPDFKRIIERFIFLRFAREPYQDLEFTKEQIDGFKYYLSYISKIINEFSERDAKLDYALHDPKRKWKCGTKSGWKCPFRDPFTYYHLVDENEKVIKSVLEESYLEKFQYEPIATNQKWKIMKYSGCPAHYEHDNFI